MNRENHRISEKVKETINFNLNMIGSSVFDMKYNDLNWFIIERRLKELYLNVLRIINQLPNSNYYLYENKSVVEIDFEKFTRSSYLQKNEEYKHESAIEILYRLTEIGLLKEISYEILLKESLSNNHLYYVNLLKKNESHKNFFIIQKLDQEYLSNIQQNLETQIDSLKKVKETKEISQDKPLLNFKDSDVRTKEDFYRNIEYLQEEISYLNNSDEASEKYKNFIEDEMGYTYSLLISQCKLHKEIDLSIKVGRPAFLWRLDQLKVKFKRMHAFKDVSFYLQRIDYLVDLGAIKRINFNQIESDLLKFIDEKDSKKKPDLYIFPNINPSMLSKFAEFKLENLKKEGLSIFGEESGTRIFDSQQNAELQSIEKDESRNSFDSKVIKLEYEGISKDEEVSWVGLKVADKHKERIKYNLDKISSDFFEEIYKPIDQYLVENELKIFYGEILKHILRKNDNLLEYKNNPIFYIDNKTLVQIYNLVFPHWVTSDEASKLYNSLLELGLFEEISPQTVATDLKLTAQDLGNEIRNKYSKSFNDDSKLYILNRLNENTLKRIFNKIKLLNKSGKSNSKSVNTNMEYTERIAEKAEESDSKLINPIVEIDYSITESALEILIESKIEGNKVIIDKSSFDNLIKAILGEVPDI